jgi:ABC-type transport system involved in multi-copper enzyme maturation permease subunit
VTDAPDPPPPAKRPPRAGLVGPLFGWELVRLARRGHDARARFILAATLLFVLTAFTQVWFWGVSPADVFLGTSQSLTIEESARFGRSFAFTFVVAQLAVMLLLTPAYAAGGISEEKERQTLTYLLVSDLTSREVFFGKFAGRLVFLLGILFAGLPILTMTTLYGGVSLNFLLTSYLLTAATVTMYAAISAAAAMAADTYRGALFRSYGLAAIHVFAGCGLSPMYGPFGIVSYLFALGDSPEFLLGLGLGYPAVELAVAALAVYFGVRWTRRLRAKPRDRATREDRREARRAAARPPAHDFEVLDDGVDAELPVARRIDTPAGPVGGEPAVRRLGSADRRAAAPRMRQRRRPPPVRTPLPYVARQRPRITGNPFVWKERYTTGQKFTADDESIRGVLTGVGIAAAFLVAFFGLLVLLALVVGQFNASTRAVATGFCLLCGSGGYFVYLVVIGIGATGAVVKERQRNTLESLRAIPVDRRTILAPKLHAAGRRARWWGAGTGLMLAGGFAFSRVPPVALPMLGFVAACAPAVLAYGLFLSVRCRTATKAALWLLPAVAAAVVIPLAVWVNLDDRHMLFWTLLTTALFAAVAPLGWLFWRRAVADFERDGRA